MTRVSRRWAPSSISASSTRFSKRKARGSPTKARSSAKAAILGFTKALAREIADTGVTVNAVTPGAVDTNIRVGSTDEQEAKLAADIPVGRTATTEEIAAVITFLSSQDASYLTGTTVDINGGSHIH